MVKRFKPKTIVFVPLAGAPVQLNRAVGRLVFQGVEEQIGKEWVDKLFVQIDNYRKAK